MLLNGSFYGDEEINLFRVNYIKKGAYSSFLFRILYSKFAFIIINRKKLQNVVK